MQMSAVRRNGIKGNGAVAGSVWEARMKMDEIKGGIKVFNGNDSQVDDADEDGLRVYRRLRRSQTGNAAAVKKRKNWKTPESNEIQLGKVRSDISSSRNGEIGKKSGPVIGDEGEEEDEEVVDIEMEADEAKDGSCDDKEIDEPLEKTKIAEEELTDDDEEEDEISENPESVMALGTEKCESVDVADRREANRELEILPETEKKSDAPAVHILPAKKPEPAKSSSPEKKPAAAAAPTANSDTRKHSVGVAAVAMKPIPAARLTERKPDSSPDHREVNPDPAKTSPGDVKQEKRTFPVIKTCEPTRSPPGKQPPPAINRRPSRLPDCKPPPTGENVFRDAASHDSMLQNIVHLVMWRNVPKSAFVFGLGTFLLLSSSYAKGLEFNVISAVSYLGLIYLGLIFIYKSVLHRGARVEDVEEDGRYIFGEEEAIWLLRKLLPHINELLLKLRSLFSGDPGTTMKLALLLFAMARFGSFLTFWTLSKLVFFGVFIIPKMCCSYSTQLARYGKFWIERFRDGWESCTHKKAVAAAIFILIWNVSSTIARAWAVFMLVVAFKLYQQHAVDWGEEEEESAATPEEPPEVSTKAGKQLSFASQNGRRQGLSSSVHATRRSERLVKREF